MEKKAFSISKKWFKDHNLYMRDITMGCTQGLVLYSTNPVSDNPLKLLYVTRTGGTATGPLFQYHDVYEDGEIGDPHPPFEIRPLYEVPMALGINLNISVSFDGDLDGYNI